MLCPILLPSPNNFPCNFFLKRVCFFNNVGGPLTTFGSGYPHFAVLRGSFLRNCLSAGATIPTACRKQSLLFKFLLGRKAPIFHFVEKRKNLQPNLHPFFPIPPAPYPRGLVASKACSSSFYLVARLPFSTLWKNVKTCN